MKKCPSCGFEIENEAKYCPYCGFGIDDSAITNEKTERIYEDTINRKYETNYTSVNTSNEILEEPISFLNWLLILFLLQIPLVNIILLFIWGFGSDKENISRRNFCRAYLIYLAIGIALAIIWIFGMFMMFVNLFD